MSQKEIATELSISIKTIEGYLASAKVKMGARSPLHAARLYTDQLQMAPGISPEAISRVDPDRSQPSTGGGSAADVAVPVGRIIHLKWQARTAIIVALAFVIILSILVIVAGADGITRLAHDYGQSNNH